MMKRKPMFPRDAAGSLTLPGGEEITAMCGLGDRMEIYTPSQTFVIRTPESTDPERTNPNALWTRVKTHDVGSASPLVARTFIQAHDVLHQRPMGEACDYDALLKRMHAIKETLLHCDSACRRYLDALQGELDALGASEYKLAPGARALEYFPVICELDAKVTDILINARRVITEVCQLPRHFWPQGRLHSNLEHLVEKELEPRLGSSSPLVAQCQAHLDGTRRLLELRNGQEHGSTTNTPRLHTRNFEHAPTNELNAPVWFLDGEEPQDISAAAKVIPTFLAGLVESVFIGCVYHALDAWPPWCFVDIEPVDSKCPQRYRLTMDVSRLNLPMEPGEEGSA